MSWVIEKSRDNYDVIKIEVANKYKYIGSKYNQKREVEKFIKDIGELRSGDIYIVFGISCCEHIKELMILKKSKKRILIIEHNEELIEENMKKNDICNSNDVLITNKESEIRYFIRSIKSSVIDNLKILHYSNYSKLFNYEVKGFFNIIKEEVSTKIINRNTEIRFTEKWFETNISNMKYSEEAMPINELRDKFKNIPAVIVSAGPSLEKNIKELKGFEKGLILTGGRTLRALLNEGINPDLLVGLDAADESYELVKSKIKNVKIPLVFNSTTNLDIVKNHNYKKIVFGSNSFFEFNNIKLESLAWGGSVAHTMTRCALFLGCNPIIFVGQDLAYTGELGHAKIAYNEFDSEALEARDSELFEKKYKKNSDIYVEDIYGGEVRTGVVLNDFIRAFERMILAYPDRRFIDATEGGALIKGTEIETLKNTIMNLSEKKYENIAGLIKSMEYEKMLDEYLELIEKSIYEGVGFCTRGKKELEKMKYKYIRGQKINEEIKKLDIIDEEIKKCESIKFINEYIFKKILKLENDEKYKIINDDNKKVIFEKVYSKNKLIYDHIEFCLEDLKKELKKVFND
ncbi:MAG: motility associated factor glycosyltransferase family protein [Sarcina sp.]